MALTPLRLPRLQQGLAIVDPRAGKPSAAFVRYWNVELLTAIERQINDIAAIQADLAAVQAEQAAQLLLIEQSQQDIIAAQEQLAAQVVQIQSLLGLVQGATQAANDAQATADDALGAGTVSGSATAPSVDLVTDGAWVTGPIVNLLAVVAGNLTITGSGPLQDEDVALAGGSTAACEFRIMEVILGVDTLKFTGTFTVDAGGFPATVINLSSATVAAYTSAEASTGSVSYRIDARKVSGAVVTDLALYIYARRAA